MSDIQLRGLSKEQNINLWNFIEKKLIKKCKLDENIMFFWPGCGFLNQFLVFNAWVRDKIKFQGKRFLKDLGKNLKLCRKYYPIMYETICESEWNYLFYPDNSSYIEHSNMRQKCSRKEMDTPFVSSIPKKLKTDSAPNAFSELANLLGKNEVELLTNFNDPAVTTFFKKYLSCDNIENLLKNLGPAWAGLFLFLLDVCDRKYPNIHMFKDKFATVKEKLYNRASVAELVCWEGDTSERESYMKKNFFSWIEKTSFLYKCGVDSQPNLVHQTHLNELYKEFINVLDNNDSPDSTLIRKEAKCAIMKERVGIVTRLMEKSDRRAPIEKLQTDLLESYNTHIAEQGIVKLTIVSEPEAHKYVNKIKIDCGLSDDGCSELKKIVDLWIENNLAENSEESKKNFIDSLKEALSTTDPTKMSTASILLCNRLISSQQIKFN